MHFKSAMKGSLEDQEAEVVRGDPHTAHIRKMNLIFMFLDQK